MALKVNPDAQVIFFAKLFGDTHAVVQTVKGLVAHGYEFEVGLFTVTAKQKSTGVSSLVQLTKGSTALMKAEKGLLNPKIVDQNKMAIVEWISKLSVDVTTPNQAVMPVEPVKSKSFSVILLGAEPGMNALVAVKAIHKLLGTGLNAAKKIVDAVKQGEKPLFSSGSSESVSTEYGMVLLNAGLKTIALPDDAVDAYLSLYNQMTPTPSTPPVVKTPVAGVIALRDAKVIGQKVHGTSSGSVYHCVALNDRVRVAARIFSNGQISIRAEWEGATTEELDRLKDAGFSMKGAYASMHLNADSVPHARVIGSFIIGLGIEWNEAVMSGNKLVVG